MTTKPSKDRLREIERALADDYEIVKNLRKNHGSMTGDEIREKLDELQSDRIDPKQGED